MAKRRARPAYRVGNGGLVVGIPSEFAQALKIEHKTMLVFEVEGAKLIVRNLDAMPMDQLQSPTMEATTV